MLIFIFKLVVFLILCPTVLFFLGRIIIGSYSTKLKSLEVLLLSLVFGIFLIIIQAIVFGMLNIRYVSLPLISVIFIISFLKYFRDYLAGIYQIFKDKILLLLLVVGIIVQGFINFPSGWRYSNGINFWSSQGHDGLWHVSLMEEIKNVFPPTNPLYANHQMQNYHFTSDIFMGEFYRLFPFFSSLDLYFRFYPILFSFLIGLSVFVFVARKWNDKAAYIAIGFTYFSGSFGYIVSLLNHGFLFSGETTFWASQGNTILGNPPHALGIILLTTILFILSVWEKTKTNIWLIFIVILGFGLATVKVSSGAIFSVSILAAGAIYFIQTRKLSLLIAGIIVTVGNYICLKFISPSAQSFIIFEPLWFPRTMMVVRLDWMDWEMRRQHYMWVNTWRSWIRVVSLEMQAILIFILGNTGVRVLAVGEIISNIRKKNISSVDIFMYTGSMAAVVVVLLFVQSGITFNLIQFIQIYLHFMGILAGVTLWKITQKFNKPLYKIGIILLIFIFGIPTVVGNLFEFYGPGKKPLAYISNSEIEGLDWIKNNTSKDSVIFTKPFDKNAFYRYKIHPLPISGWYSTMYVHSISGRRTFLSGEEQLVITGYNIDDDRKKATDFMQQLDIIRDNKFLVEAKIHYLYFRRDELDKPINQQNQNLKQVYSNNEVVIYKYVKS